MFANQGDILKQYLPSKTFVGVALPLVMGFAVATFVIYTNITEINAQQQSAGLVAFQQAQGGNLLERKKLIEADADNDGLKDWEEGLWATDPDNPDTDGDGTFDGEEVENGRNPKLAGPNDLLNTNSATADGQTGATGTSSGRLTVTEEITKDFIGTYLSTRIINGEQPLDVATKNQMAEEMVRNTVVTAKQLLEPVDVSNITIVEQATPEQIRAYHASIMRVWGTFDLITESDVEQIFTTVSDPLLPFNLEVMRNYPQIYEQVIDELLALSVPKEASRAHILSIIAINELKFFVEGLLAYHNDPMGTISAIMTFPASQKNMNNAAELFRAYFAKHNLPNTQ